MPRHEICPGVTMYPGSILVPRKYPGTPEVSLLARVIINTLRGYATVRGCNPPEGSPEGVIPFSEASSRAKRGRPAERSEAPPNEAAARRSSGGRHYKKTQKGSTRKPRGTTYFFFCCGKLKKGPGSGRNPVFFFFVGDLLDGFFSICNKN